MTNHQRAMRRRIRLRFSNRSCRRVIESSPRKNATLCGATQRNGRHITVVDQAVVTFNIKGPMRQAHRTF